MVLNKEQQLRYMAIGLFVLGVSLSIINGAKVTTGNETLIPFFLGIAIAALGLIFWHITERKLHRILLDSKVKSGVNPFLNIVNASEAAALLLKKINEENPDSDMICDAVDQIQEKSLIPFVEIRSAVLDLLGYSEGCDVLINIAHGERLLNRVWSCAADGYIEETKQILPEVISTFNNVLKKNKTS